MTEINHFAYLKRNLNSRIGRKKYEIPKIERKQRTAINGYQNKESQFNILIT